MVKNLIRVAFIIVCLMNTGCELLDIEFTAKIDGKDFKAGVGWWQESYIANVLCGSITAIDADGNRFFILITGEFEETTYTFSLPSTDRLAQYITKDGFIYSHESGSLTITSKNDRLKGEFEFTLSGYNPAGDEIVKLEVTDGMLDLPPFD